MAAGTNDGMQHPMNGGRNTMRVKRWEEDKEEEMAWRITIENSRREKASWSTGGRQGILGAGRAVKSGSGGVGFLLRTLSNPGG